MATAATIDPARQNSGGAEPGAIAPYEGGEAPTSRGAPEGPYGPNNERLEELKPRCVAALRDLVLQYRQEGIVSRRHEIRRIRQARLFWQGLQYAWWSPQDMQWHLPLSGSQAGLGMDARELEEMPRYQFVTNFYQGFGLSFIAVISQDVPAVRFYPQSAQSEEDIAAAKAASKAAELIEQNNKVQSLLTGVGYFLWTDGKIGGYVRYVADGQRFGFHQRELLEPAEVKLGADVYLCPNCGAETLAGDSAGPAGRGTTPEGGVPTMWGLAGPNFLSGVICEQCGTALGPADFQPAERAAVPRLVGVRRVPNGQEVMSIVGGLELNSPVWASEQHEYPYLQWTMEVHRAKLRASYPHAADKIQVGGPVDAEEVYARASRVAVAQGLPTIHPGDALHNLITFSRTWIRPWAFYALEDNQVRDELLALFPDGCYVAFAGDTYCESRNEALDDHWRVMHALPGDGQNRPSVGDSLIQLQERYNVLSNIQAETYEFGIPPIYADPQTLDFEALANQIAEPAAHYPARARAGQPLAASFFQPAPAQVAPDMMRHMQELIGPIPQFLTGLFPAVFGGEMTNQKTATGYAMAREQALGRIGLVWRRLKQFYADLMLLGVDCFRKNRPDDVEIPILGEGGEFQSEWIRLADLKGNIQAHPEADETFPRLRSQQRAVLQQLMASTDPVIQRILAEPDNLTYIKGLIGLAEIVVPGEDARNKQLREIQLLLASGPLHLPGAREQARDAGGQQPAQVGEAEPSRLGAEPRLGGPSVPVDELLDDHAVEFEVCKRWASSDAGQTARVENPLGFANVRAHAAAHLAALRREAADAAAR